MTSDSRLTYRPDIDGLRAIAVMSVVIFHAGFEAGGIELLPGGFLCVDVFFVISGFLITSLIHAEIQGGEFSMPAFYERRLRRLMPALMSVLLATLPLSWWLLFERDLQTYAGSVLATLAFVSNVFFLFESSYGANALAFEPLLHTWSLAVEEQYYLVFPLLFVVLVRRSMQLLVIALLLLALASFVMAVVMVPVARDVAFYLLPTRLWELLAGGLLALWRAGAVRGHALGGAVNGERCVASGLLLIVASMLLATEASLHPSWMTLMPVAGTMLVILGGEQPGRLRSLLCSRPFVFVGLISYSLYLWHQPLLVFTRHYLYGPMPDWLKLGVVVISILFAAASWR